MSLLSPPLQRSANPIVVVDGDRRFVDANRAACELVDRPRVELLQMRVDELTPPTWIPELENRWTEFLRSGLATGRWALRLHGAEVVEFHYVAMAAIEPDRHLVVATVPGAEPAGAAASAAAAGTAVSARERTVLTLLAGGRTGPEIADELIVSLDTVRTHIRALKAKLEAKTLAHLIAIALRDGLVEEGPGPHK
jgi:DNA-binding CsgD family transcriptional regulator